MVHFAPINFTRTSTWNRLPCNTSNSQCSEGILQATWHYKSKLREILSLAQSDCERELIGYTAFVSGQFSQTSARKLLGLDDMKRCTAEIERCTKEAREIREAIDEMAMAEICSLAINHGLSGSEDECDSGSDVDLD